MRLFENGDDLIDREASAVNVILKTSHNIVTSKFQHKQIIDIFEEARTKERMKKCRAVVDLYEFLCLHSTQVDTDYEDFAYDLFQRAGMRHGQDPSEDAKHIIIS